jgi:hypothetical protein
VTIALADTVTSTNGMFSYCMIRFHFLFIIIICLTSNAILHEKDNKDSHFDSKYIHIGRRSIFRNACLSLGIVESFWAPLLPGGETRASEFLI